MELDEITLSSMQLVWTHDANLDQLHTGGHDKLHMGLM